MILSTLLQSTNSVDSVAPDYVGFWIGLGTMAFMLIASIVVYTKRYFTNRSQKKVDRIHKEISDKYGKEKKES